jgi:hypothetical protein
VRPAVVRWRWMGEWFSLSTSWLFATNFIVLLVGQFNCVRLLFVEREIRAPSPRN